MEKRKGDLQVLDWLAATQPLAGRWEFFGDDGARSIKAMDSVGQELKIFFFAFKFGGVEPQLTNHGYPLDVSSRRGLFYHQQWQNID